jgi:outer membrane receptor for ferrienterochelin and colicins
MQGFGHLYQRESWPLLFLTLFIALIIITINPYRVDANEEQNNIVRLDTITVTTPGYETRIKDVEATIEIIHADQIEKTSRRSLSQVIQKATSFFINDTGSNSDPSLRGFSSGQALILVDGMRRTGKYGSTRLNSIPLENIEQIEIVRGPMSALYGSDAMAGVINIVTRKAASEKSFLANLSTGMADNGDRETGIARFSGDLGIIGGIQHRLSAELKSRGDYRETDSQPYTDLNDSDRHALSYNGVLDISETQRLLFSAAYTKEDSEGISSSAPLGFPTTFEKEESYHFAGNFRQDTSFGLFDISAGGSTTDADVDRTGGVEQTDYDLYELNGFMTYDRHENHKLIIGTGARHEKISITPLLTQSPERDVLHALIQDSWQISPLFSLMGGLRYDHFSDFGNTWNPRISLTVTPADFKFRIGYGEAFKAPTFIEQYGYFERAAGPRLHKIYGNRNLQPEESRTFELGAAYYADKFDVELVYHYSNVENLIESTVINTAGMLVESSYRNVGEADISGLEAILNIPVN